MKGGWSPRGEEAKNKLIAKYGGTMSDFYSDGPDYDPEPEPRPDRTISVTLNEAEQELLTAVFYNAAIPDSEVIQESDWDLMVTLAKKLGVGDINQF